MRDFAKPMRESIRAIFMLQPFISYYLCCTPLFIVAPPSWLINFFVHHLICKSGADNVFDKIYISIKTNRSGWDDGMVRRTERREEKTQRSENQNHNPQSNNCSRCRCRDEFIENVLILCKSKRHFLNSVVFRQFPGTFE